MHSRRRFLSAALGLSAVALATPSFARAQTPPSGASVDPTLFDYLSISPSSVANLTQAMPLLAGNQQLQAETLDIALPFDMNDDDQMHEWIVGMFNVALPSFILQNTMREDFVSVTGFDITQVTSGAEIGEPPSMVTFLRGTFEPAAVQAVQLLNGYKQLDIDGRPVYSLFEDAEVDLTHPVSAMALARMNNSTFLDDGTLVYASTLELIEQVLTPGPTLAEQPGVMQALNTLETPLMSSAVLGPGNFLPGIPPELFQPSSQDEIAEAMEALRAQKPVPVVLAAIAGDTPGGPVEFKTRDAVSLASQPDSLTTFALVYATPEDAQTAATQIEERLATGSSMASSEPWSELFSDWSAVPNPEQSSVLLTIKWNGRAGRAINLVFNRDLGFITG
jgi:hypothetical protein